MPACKTMCCLRFERKGRACRDCPILESLPGSMRPGWLRRLDKRAMVQWWVGEQATRYLVRLKRRIKATVRR